MRGINLLFVAESDRLKCQERFAGFIHRPDVFLIASRGRKGADLIIRIDVNNTSSGLRSVNISDVSGVGFAADTEQTCSDVNIPVAVGCKQTGTVAQGGVVATGRVISECSITDRRVGASCRVLSKRELTGDCVVNADGIAGQRKSSVRRVVQARGVFRERSKTI